MADILFVTWDGGGNVPPATAIAAELRRRGHRVRFVGHASQRAPLEAQGFEVEPTTHARPFAADDPQSVLAMIRMFGDRGLGRDALAALARRPADLVVVDCLLLGAMEELRRDRDGAGTPYVVLEHLYDAFFRRFVPARTDRHRPATDGPPPRVPPSTRPARPWSPPCRSSTRRGSRPGTT